jgi:hypothetical protein
MSHLPLEPLDPELERLLSPQYLPNSPWRSTTHSHTAQNDYITNSQYSREYNFHPFLTGHNDRHGPYHTQIHSWMLPPIPKADMYLGAAWEVRND